jgi:glutathione S-transferase
MLTVHHLNNSRSQRILWLLEELGVEYDIKRYTRNSETLRAPPDLKAVHPLGRSPVIADGGTVVAETGAIVEYLLERYGHGRLRPAPGTEAARRFTYCLHFAEGSQMPPLLLRLIFDRLAAAKMPFFARPIVRGVARKVRAGFIDPQIDEHLSFLESELGRSAWFAGEDFTAADIQMSFPVEVSAVRAGLGANRPRLADFLARIHARSAYLRALDRGGAYAYA